MLSDSGSVFIDEHINRKRILLRNFNFETVDADDSISKLTETTYHYNTGWGVILDGPPIDPFHRIQTQK